ncbi:tetratricopeptide repeat protein [Fusobacterium sp.]|uniref:tetratricopeptide repeat protein n=1 Tax=Fusobacterium sp. TaxID=68766 RepID=UPI002903E9CA|nr:tetratricopeptide repeat protein [Fusobacterium sp.]MDU1911295.1 tetratricopeptide repeat protein [Fusobacterium sp.]
MKKIFFLLGILLLSGCSGAGKREKNLIQNDHAFIKGVNLYHKGKKKEALKEYEQIYKNDSKNLMVMKEMAIVNCELGNKEAAIYYLEKAYEIAPNDESVIKNLANVYYRDKQFEKAEKYLNMFFKNSNDNDILKLRGYIAYAKNDYEKSYNYLKEVQEEKYDMRLYHTIKNNLIKLDKKENLYSLLNKKYDNYSNERDYIILYCDSLSTIFNEKDSATKILLRYISEYGGDDELFLILSTLYLENGEEKKALNSFKLISNNYKYKPEYIELKKSLNRNSIEN